MAVKSTNESFPQDIEEGLVLADFYSDSCIPCKRMSPVLAELEEENPEVKLVKLNINFGAETAAKYEVASVPTLVFFRDGNEIRRITGAVRKAQIEEIIKTI